MNTLRAESPCHQFMTEPKTKYYLPPIGRAVGAYSLAQMTSGVARGWYESGLLAHSLHTFFVYM